jgi:NhaA family Na+:H+ antiporter
MAVIPGRAVNAIREFLKLESASGIILVGAAVLALILNNSPISSLYDLLLDTPVEIRVGALQLAKPLLLWINDGLMAVFFLLIGLEIKRRCSTDSCRAFHKSRSRHRRGRGMAVPAPYTSFSISLPRGAKRLGDTRGDGHRFRLGIMTLLGSRVPLSLKLFLLTLAIIDDLGAIVIIAIFYSGKLSLAALVMAGIAVAALAVMNFMGVRRIAAYVIVGAVLWICVLKSGCTRPSLGWCWRSPSMRTKDEEPSPLRELEHTLHPWVAFGSCPYSLSPTRACPSTE